ATWIRSSSGSPRPSNRRAQRNAIHRWSSTSWLRATRSPLCRYSRKRSRTASSLGDTSAAFLQAEARHAAIDVEREAVARDAEDLLGRGDPPHVDGGGGSRRRVALALAAVVVQGEREQNRTTVGELEERGAQLVNSDPQIVDTFHVEARRGTHSTGDQAGDPD